MLSKICLKISQNKNFLMLISVGIYILALFSILSLNVIPITIIITLLFTYSIVKNLFPIKYIIIWSLIFFIGLANTSFRIKQTDELINFAPTNAELTGTVISIPQDVSIDKTKFFFNVNKIKTSFAEKTFDNEKTLVTITRNPNDKIKYNDIKIYDKLSISGRLSTPFKAGNPSQFDYSNYLMNFHTYSVFYTKSFYKLQHKQTLKEHLIKELNNYREYILSTHSRYLKSPNLEILGGIVFGDDAVAPPQNIKQSFINSGLLHILAASGMNVAFIYSFFFLLMSIFKINFKIKVFAGMITVLLYSLMTGLGASVVRATCMLLFVLLGKLIDRDAHSISLLSFVALLMLLYNPMYINDVGFQLSFIVTLGLLLMAPLILNIKNKILNFTLSTITIPIIAQLWVIPIQIFYFNNISLYSVFANIMSVPLLMVISFCGFVSSLLATIKPLSQIICYLFDLILNPLITLLINISDFWGKLPHASIQTTHPNIFQIILYYGILLSITAIFHSEYRKKYSKLIVKTSLTLILTLFATLIPFPNHNLEIITFDVGNADCFLIKTPNNEHIMIDSGKAGYNGGKSQAEIILLKYLKDNGIKKLDTLIITHFDNDHCGGAVDILNNIKVSKIYVNSLNHKSKAANDIYNTANLRHTKINLVKNKEIIYDKDSLILKNLKAYSGKYDNDNSIITLLTFEDFSMLFTGDAGKNGISAVINEIPQNITVFKVPHHGAIGGVDNLIVKHIAPKYSIISTGENKFGHPSFYTLEVLKNSKILRTDINNSIKFIINKKSLKALYYDINEKKYKPIY